MRDRRGQFDRLLRTLMRGAGIVFGKKTALSTLLLGTVADGGHGADVAPLAVTSMLSG